MTAAVARGAVGAGLYTSNYPSRLANLNILQRNALRTCHLSILQRNSLRTILVGLFSRTYRLAQQDLVHVVTIAQINLCQTNEFVYKYTNNMLPHVFIN